MNARTEPWADEEVSHLRVPPHSTEAEQAVLGALLLDPQAFDRVADVLHEGDFYVHAHRLVFAAVQALVMASKPADVVAVFERLQSAGKANDAGGLAYVNALAAGVAGASNARVHAEIVAEKALLRGVIAACDEGATTAFNPQGKAPAEVLDLVAAKLSALERRGMRAEPKCVADLLGAALDRYTELAGGQRTPGIATGFAQLDGMLGGGLKPGKVYGIAARPSVGKSSSARSIAIRVAAAGHPVLILSQEMPQDEQTDCVLAELGHIDSEHLQTGQMGKEDWTRLFEAADQARRLPLHFDEQGGLTLGDIRAKARTVKGLQLLVLDYLQLCSTTLKGKTTNDEVAEISKGLKKLALEMRIPIIVLSQLNRDVEKRPGGEPQLSDLRDSGAIEQDLDVAILLWTAEEHADGYSRTVGFKVAKNRGGRKGRFAMRFDAPRYGWTDSVFPQRAAPKPGKEL